MSGSLDVEGSHATVTADLAAFIADVEALTAAEHEPHRIAASVQERLPALLAEPRFLAPEHREPWPDRYRPHLLAVAPSRRFSVVALVWLPGQITPIHDHICWCVVGVLEGVERERRFHLRQDPAGQRWLTPEADVLVAPGSVSRLTPPDENIHQVRNAGIDLAISLHVYGADIGVVGSSVNQCFDDLPVREESITPGGMPIEWRGL